MPKTSIRALSIAAGLIIYDLISNPGWRSVDFKKATFVFLFCWFIFWLEQRRAANSEKAALSA